MTSALPAPSEEERRLLREYRLVSVPSRRSSCSPATSNASSSTTNPASLLGDQLLQPPPQLVAANSQQLPSPSVVLGRFSPPNKTATNGGHTTTNGHSKPSPRASPKVSPKGSQTTTTTTPTAMPLNGLIHQNHNNGSKQDSNKTLPANGTPNATLKHHPKHQQANHANHHHNNGVQAPHKKLRIASQTHELSPEEFKRILELVADLSYLKLVSMKSAATSVHHATTATNGTSTGASSNQCATQCNGIVINQIYPDKECQNEPENRLQQAPAMLELTKPGSYSGGSPASTNASSTQCIPYIFEKVDYIKKISARRKALKKFKKARKKSRSIISPNTTQNLPV